MTETALKSRKKERRNYRVKRKLRLPVLPGVLLGVLLFCASGTLWWVYKGDQTAKAAKASKVQGIDLDGHFSARFAGEMIASRTKAAANGFTLQVRALPDRPDFVADVAENGAIGVTSGAKFLLARWRGVPVTAFAASFLDTPTAIFSLYSAGIRAPKDLIGKRVSYKPGSEDGVVFDAMLAQLGLPRSQVRNISVSDGFLALRNGDIDALIGPIGSRPFPSDDPAVRLNVMRPQDYGIHIPGQVYFTNSASLRDRPSVIRKVLRAVILGWEDVYRDPDGAASTLAGYDPERLSAREARFALGQQRDLVRPVGMRIAEYEEIRWRTLRDILLYAKLGSETVGLSTAVTYEFLRDFYRRSPEAEAAEKAATRSN
jgi:ABC-type nitrate/sulfonate/bicarbonate transport system substrate-binding protein